MFAWLQSFWAVSQTRQSYSGVTTWLRSPPWCPAAASADDLGKANNLPTDLDKEGRCELNAHGKHKHMAQALCPRCAWDRLVGSVVTLRCWQESGLRMYRDMASTCTYVRRCVCMYVCSPYRVVTTDLGAFVLVSKRRVSELYEMLPALCVSLLVLPQFAKLKRVPYAHAAHMQPICSPASCMGCLD